MDGFAKRNALDNDTVNAGDKDDATAPAITQAVLSKFLTALTGAITTVVTTTVSAVQPLSTPRYSTSINPFDMKSMDLTSKDGRRKWYKATEKTGACKQVNPNVVMGSR